MCITVACLSLIGCADLPNPPDATQVATAPSSSATYTTAGIAEGSSTVGDGVYSEEQSQRGELSYLDICKRCHQRDLRGDFIEDAPPLIGDEFLSEWTPWTVGDLFEFLTTEMPPKPKDRRDVTAETYADILAYILFKNGFPAGQEDLPPAFEQLVMIEMRTGD